MLLLVTVQGRLRVLSGGVELVFVDGRRKEDESLSQNGSWWMAGSS